MKKLLFAQDTKQLFKIKLNNLIYDVEDTSHSRKELKIKLVSLKQLFSDLEKDL